VDRPVVTRGPTPREQPARLRCAFCHDHLGAREPVVCPGCGTRLHPECAGGRCPTLGCGATAGITVARPRRQDIPTTLRDFMGWVAAVFVPTLLFLLSEALGGVGVPTWREDELWSWVWQVHHPAVQRWTYPFLLGSIAAYMAAMVGRRARWIEVGLGSGVLLALGYLAIHLRILTGLRFDPALLLVLLLVLCPQAAAVWAFTGVLLRYRAEQPVATEKGADPEPGPARVWGLWAALFGGASIGAVRTMNELYAALPLQPPSECFVASATARAAPRLTRAEPVRFASGEVRLVGAQLRTLKAFELLWRALSPRTHAPVRALYDRLGPPLAARVGPRTAALAWLALLPAQLVARLALGLVLRGASGLVANTWRASPPRDAALELAGQEPG